MIVDTQSDPVIQKSAAVMVGTRWDGAVTLPSQRPCFESQCDRCDPSYAMVAGRRRAAEPLASAL